MKRLLNLIKKYWRLVCESYQLGFTTADLSRLYVELVGRDDPDWTQIERDGTKIQIKNTAFSTDGEMLSIVGDYSTGEFKKIYRFDRVAQDWEEVLNGQFPLLAKRGGWETTIKKMLKPRNG